MSRPGLVTGFEPFAGLATNPAGQLLPSLDGQEIGGVRIATRLLPVSRARVPGLVDAMVEELRPAFALSLGLAMGAAVLRVERLAVNVASFRVADNDGATPRGEPFAPGMPTALRATWDAETVVAALLAAGIPAVGSWHAGTHLCNLTLFTFLQALPASAPCGFLHLPYTPGQVAAFLATSRPHGGPGLALEQPSMPLALQREAVLITLRVLAEASTGPGRPAASAQ